MKRSPKPLTGPLRLAKAIGAAPLGRADKALLNALVLRVNYTTWEAWPSVRDLAARSSLGRRTIQQSVRRLADRGVIIVLRWSRGGRSESGRGKTHHLRLNVDALEALNGAAGHPLNAEKTTSSTTSSAPPSPTTAAQIGRHNGAAEQGVNGAAGGGEHTSISIKPINQTISPAPATPATPGAGSADPPDYWSFRSGEWMDGLPLRDVLMRLDIRGPNLEKLSTGPALTVAIVREEWESIVADPNVRSRIAVLVRRLSERAGVKLAREHRLTSDDLSTVGSIERLRRHSRAGPPPSARRGGPPGPWGIG